MDQHHWNPCCLGSTAFWSPHSLPLPGGHLHWGVGCISSLPSCLWTKEKEALPLPLAASLSLLDLVSIPWKSSRLNGGFSWSQKVFVCLAPSCHICYSFPFEKNLIFAANPWKRLVCFFRTPGSIQCSKTISSSFLYVGKKEIIAT